MTEACSATLCLVAKDEAAGLLEWVAYHRALGFDRLLIYDNDSTPEQAKPLRWLSEAGLIDLVAWPTDPATSPQLTAYADAIRRVRTAWLGFLDADEFLVLHQDVSIQSFLSRFAPQDSAIVINWRIFGSAGQTQFSPGLVTQRFTRCATRDFDPNRHVKTIARSDAIRVMHQHCCDLSRGRHVNDCGEPAVFENMAKTRTVSMRRAQVNHYHTKSRGEYRAKMLRGRAGVAAGDPAKFQKYSDEGFKWHDRNEDLDDTALGTIGRTRRAMTDVLRRLAMAQW
jgi:hypothetical protein